MATPAMTINLGTEDRDIHYGNVPANKKPYLYLYNEGGLSFKEAVKRLLYGVLHPSKSVTWGRLHDDLSQEQNGALIWIHLFREADGFVLALCGREYMLCLEDK